MSCVHAPVARFGRLFCTPWKLPTERTPSKSTVKFARLCGQMARLRHSVGLGIQLGQSLARPYPQDFDRILMRAKAERINDRIVKLS